MKYLAAIPRRCAPRSSSWWRRAARRLAAKRYGSVHDIRTDRALYDYVNELKSEFLRNAEPLSKVASTTSCT